MGWRLAKSLEVLRDEANQTAPGRNKASDGTIGDPSHSSRTSDHNPDPFGVVAALDLTHDPKHGADMHVWAERVRLSGHPALKYQIWNRRISNPDIQNGRWRAYRGSNPHTSHMHVSVKRPHYDDTQPWGILEDDMPLNDADKKWIREAIAHHVTVVIRKAVGPDDAKTPAGKYFGRVEEKLDELKAVGATGGLSDADVLRVRDAVIAWHTRGYAKQ